MMRSTGGGDEGIGLIELIVAIVISGLFLVVVGTMFVNAWMAQEQVVSTTKATNAGQLTGSAIERALRNALFYEISDGDRVLRVRTSLDGDLRCQGFRFTDGPAPAFGTVQSSRDADALPSDELAWPAQSGISREGTTPFLARSEEGTLSYSFQVAAGATPVRIFGDVTPRTPQAGGSDGCW